MAVAAYALTTLDKAKAYIGGIALSQASDDSLLEDMINAASEMIIQYTGRDFSALDTVTTRRFAVGSDGSVDLAPYELSAVASIRTNVEGTSPTTLSASDYQLLPADITSGGGYRRIRLLSGYMNPGVWGWGGNQPALGMVEIIGSWGWANTPVSVDLLCRQQVKQWYERDRASRSSVVAADDTGAPSFTPAFGLAPGIKRALDVYRTPVVA